MFWRGLIGYLPVNIVQALAGFGAIVAFTRLLTPEQYGDYALGFSVSSLTSTCLFTWLEAAMGRFYIAEQTNNGRQALYGTLYRTFALMAVIVPATAGAVLAFLPLTPELRIAVVSGILATITRSLLKLAQERRRAAGLVAGFAVLDIAQTSGAFLIGLALAVLGFGGGAPLAGIGIASALCLIFALPSELKMAGKGRFDGKRLRSYASYGMPITLSLLMSLAIANTDRFVIAAYMGPGAVGAYHAGYSLANRTLDVMFIWLGMAGGPAAIAALERGGTVALKKVARDQASLMLLIALPAAAGLALVARPLAQLMVGPALSTEAAGVTVWIAASATFAGVTTYYFHTAFTLSRQTLRMLIAMAIPATVNLALTLLLIPKFGLQGAMWATTASYAIGLVASALIGRSCITLPIPWGALGRIMTATLVMTLMVQLVPASGGFLELCCKALVGVSTYGVAAFALDAAHLRQNLSRLLRTGRLEFSA